MNPKSKPVDPNVQAMADEVHTQLINYIETGAGCTQQSGTDVFQRPVTENVKQFANYLTATQVQKEK